MKLSFWKGAKAPLPENKQSPSKSRNFFYRKFMKPLIYTAAVGVAVVTPLVLQAQNRGQLYTVDIAQYEQLTQTPSGFNWKFYRKMEIFKGLRTMTTRYEAIKQIKMRPCSIKDVLLRIPNGALLSVNLIHMKTPTHGMTQEVEPLPSAPNDALLRANLLNPNSKNYQVGFHMAPKLYGFGESATLPWPYDKGVTDMIGIYVKPRVHMHRVPSGPMLYENASDLNYQRAQLRMWNKNETSVYLVK